MQPMLPVWKQPLSDRMSNLQRITKLIDDFDEGLGSKFGLLINCMNRKRPWSSLGKPAHMKTMDKAYQDRDEATFAEALEEAKKHGTTLQYHVDRQLNML